MTPQAPRDFNVDDFDFGMMELKVERLQALPLNASGTGSTGSEVRLGEDRKADPGLAAGPTFPIQPWRTLVFCPRSWRGGSWRGFALGFPETETSEHQPLDETAKRPTCR